MDELSQPNFWFPGGLCGDCMERCEDSNDWMPPQPDAIARLRSLLVEAAFDEEIARKIAELVHAWHEP